MFESEHLVETGKADVRRKREAPLSRPWASTGGRQEAVSNAISLRELMCEKTELPLGRGGSHWGLEVSILSAQSSHEHPDWTIICKQRLKMDPILAKPNALSSIWEAGCEK